MISLNNLLHPKGNLEEVAFVLCRDNGVKVTQTTLSRQLQVHPDYPSLAALNDILLQYQIETVALKDCDLQTIEQTTDGFLVQTKTSGQAEQFAYIYKLTVNDVYWYNTRKHRKEKTSRTQFAEFFTGYALFLDASDKTDSNAYRNQRQKEMVGHLTVNSLIMFLPIMSIICLGLYIFTLGGEHFWFTISYTTFLLVGFLLGSLLLLYEYNQHSPMVNKICNISSKTNCAAILFSSASKIYGIPWSVIGTAYFGGILMSFFVSWFSFPVMYIATLLHLLTIPYIGYSIYYQYWKAHQWCLLCISVLVVLSLLLVSAIFGKMYCIDLQIELNSIIILSICLFTSFTALFLLWNLSLQYKLRLHTERSLIRIKYNKEVFVALLHNEQQIEMPSSDCGIVLGNPHGNIHIVKISNPYCSHCAAAQPVLQKLADKNPEVKLQMIFATDPNSEYYKYTPIDLFLSLYFEQADIKTTLSEWYASKDKNLEDFKRRHPLYSLADSRRNKEAAEKMFLFCQQAHVKGTPTIFINGHLFPDVYRVKDLLYFI